MIILSFTESSRADKKKEVSEKIMPPLGSQRFEPGDSLDEHRRIEEGAIHLTGEEIKQQNENL